MSDKLLRVNSGAKFQHKCRFIISHVVYYKIAMGTFGEKFPEAINKSKTHHCKRTLSPIHVINYYMILKWNQMVYS